MEDKDFKYGHIIAEAELVDCIYMDEQFLKEIKENNQEYICGEYSLGRYAWKLSNIKVLDKPIPAKGNLGIWNYND